MFIGMDTDGALQVLQKISPYPTELEGWINRTDQEVKKSVWIGADAIDFDAAWKAELPFLKQLHEKYRFFIHWLEREITEQEQASEPEPVSHNPSNWGVHSPYFGPIWGPISIPETERLLRAIRFANTVFARAIRQATVDVYGNSLEIPALGIQYVGLAALALTGNETAGYKQTITYQKHFADDLMAALSGRQHIPVSRLAAGEILWLSSSGVAIAEILSGKQLPLLKQRDPIVVGVTKVAKPSKPENLPSLIKENGALREAFVNPADATKILQPDQAQQISIRQIKTKAGEEIALVQLPSTNGGGITNPDAWGKQKNPFGWFQNLLAAAGLETSGDKAAQKALTATDAGGNPLIKPGQKVFIVGHSQGGVSAAKLAADPNFNNNSGAPGTYRIAGVYTIGSPNQNQYAVRGTEVVNIAHAPHFDAQSLITGHASGDIIPGLDGQNISLDLVAKPSSGHKEIYLRGYSGSPASYEFLKANHDIEASYNGHPAGYYHSIQTQQQSNPELVRLNEELDGKLYGDDITVVAEYRVAVSS